MFHIWRRSTEYTYAVIAQQLLGRSLRQSSSLEDVKFLNIDATESDLVQECIRSTLD